MKAELVTKGFERTPSMDELFQEVTQEFTETFLKNDKDVHLRITVDEDSHRHMNRKPHFFCEFQIKTSSSKKYFKTHKTAADFRTALNGAVRAMKTLLQKNSSRRHDMKAYQGQEDSGIPVAG